MRSTWRNLWLFRVLIVLLLLPEAAPAESGVAQIAQGGTPVTARRAVRSSRSLFIARGGSCPTEGRNAEALAAARQAVRNECDCFGSASHSAYLRCVNRVVDAAIADRGLPSGCRRTILDFADRSACGQRDAVTCCVQQANGRWLPLLGRAPRYCESSPGRLVCQAHFLHLDDACLPDAGCRDSTCGDGIVNRWNGEACEPPGGPGCDSFCHIIYCGNGVVDADAGEECEPPGTATCNAFCRRNLCGNGVVDPIDEQCEPPGTPTCSATCTFNRECGNGVVDLPAGEDCEPPGTSACDAACHFIATCGNRVIEPGEECDGQPGCAHGPPRTIGSSRCTLLRSVCCELGDTCIEGEATNDFDAYFNYFKPCFQIFSGQGSYGVCEGTEPCSDASAGLDCRVGSCVDQPLDPLPLCCQQADGTCRDTIASSSSALAAFGCGTVFMFPEQGDIDRLMLGSCGVDGRCIPAP